MNYQDNQFIVAQDLSFAGVLHDIKKAKTALQPVFECFTNALEAIKIKQAKVPNYNGEISINIYASETTVENTELNALSITDDGIGFTEEEFKRFNTYKLTTKGFKNLGSGRIQYVCGVEVYSAFNIHHSTLNQRFWIHSILKIQRLTAWWYIVWATRGVKKA